MNNQQLTDIPTSDGLNLPGILFECPGSKKAAIYLHGNGSSSVFYSGDNNRIMADGLNSVGITYLAFNNRGAHIVKKLNRKKEDGTVERKPYGTAYELIKDCVIDIDGAIAHLKTLGYEDFYLIGESTGANKICVYDHYKTGNEVSKYVLASGGDDSGLYCQEFGVELFKQVLQETKQKIDAGQGVEIAANRVTDIMGIMSNQSAYDTLSPDGDYNTFPFNDEFNGLKLSSKTLFAHYGGIIKPTLAIYGGDDEFCYNDVPRVVEALKQYAHHDAETEYSIVPGADHGFDGAYGEYVRQVAEFLK